jgi:hypothetical protein
VRPEIGGTLPGFPDRGGTAQSRLHALSCRDWNADRPAASGQRA